MQIPNVSVRTIAPWSVRTPGVVFEEVQSLHPGAPLGHLPVAKMDAATATVGAQAVVGEDAVVVT